MGSHEIIFGEFVRKQEKRFEAGGNEMISEIYVYISQPHSR